MSKKVRGMIESILYLNARRPNNSGCLCERLQSTPMDSHLKAMKKISTLLELRTLVRDI